MAYSLTMMVTAIPYILFDSKSFKLIGFKLSELILLSLIAFAALYFAILMGRRITIFTLLIVLFFVAVNSFISSTGKERIQYVLILLMLLASSALVIYHFRDSISLFERIRHEGLGDSSRLLLWSQGWHSMMEYPWGGGGYKIIFAIKSL